jgi:hypothetical protein
MKPVTRFDFDQDALRQPSFAATVIGELENFYQIEHSNHFSPTNFTVSLLDGLIAYCLIPVKPKFPLRSASALLNLWLTPI